MHDEEDRLISSAEICRLLGCHHTTIYRQMKRDPSFPRPIKGVTGARLAWRLSAVRDYVARKEQESAETEGAA